MDNQSINKNNQSFYQFLLLRCYGDGLSEGKMSGLGSALARSGKCVQFSSYMIWKRSLIYLYFTL